MIANKNLDRLLGIETVQQFMQKHGMRGMMCDDSFILFRLPYVIGFTDYLIENYLPITLSELNSELLISDGSLTSCAIDLNFQDRIELRNRSYENQFSNDIFLSEASQKMYGLQVGLENIDKLLPLIEFKGGLVSLKNGSFDSRFDFSDLVRPMYKHLKVDYLKCINSKAIA